MGLIKRDESHSGDSGRNLLVVPTVISAQKYLDSVRTNSSPQTSFAFGGAAGRHPGRFLLTTAMPLPAPGWSGYFQQHQAPIADEWPHDQYQQQEDVDAPLSTTLSFSRNTCSELCLSTACDDYYDLKDQCDDLHRQLAECTSAREAAEQESEQVTIIHWPMLVHLKYAQLRCEKGHLALRATSAESNIRRVDQQLAAEKEAR